MAPLREGKVARGGPEIQSRRAGPREAYGAATSTGFREPWPSALRCGAGSDRAPRSAKPPHL